jgi:hypothetical protein
MADDQHALVLDLTALATELAAVMEQETACLETGRWDTLAALGPEKSRLSLRYDTLMTAMTQVSTAALRADSAFPGLSAAASRLDRAARVNALRLSIQIKANQRIASLVANAARAAVAPTISYGKTRSGFGHRLRDAAPPVAVSQVL